MPNTNRVYKAKSFLQDLRSNKSGNTFAMAAAALFPIAGVIGGGVDIGRGYMAKARLQQACDAAALAGRRSMTADTLSNTDKQEARKLFDFNFPEGTFGTANFEQVDGKDNPRFVDGSENRTVDGFAQTTIPTTIMRLFGSTEMTIKVSCTSKLDVGNVDVMMVLDVTGSMAGTRIAGLKDAVEEFYNTLGPGQAGPGNELNQIRYGFVPYNALVNVGQLLYDEDPTWLVGGTADERWTYQTRRSTWETTSPVLGDPKSSNEAISFETWTQMDGPECVNGFGDNQGVSGWFNPNPSGNPVVTQTQGGGETTVTTITYEYHTWDGNANPPPPEAVGSAYWRNCERKVRTLTEVYDTPVPVTVDVWENGATNFAGWEYGYFSHDVSGYVQSISAANPAAQRPTTNGLQLDRWQGCIEERNTDSTITASTTTIPAGALDLDMDLIPTDQASRWRPYWPGVAYDRSSSTNGWAAGTSACPVAARRLAEYGEYDDGTPNDLQSYIDGFVATGNTNHTIGMIWGLRLLSDAGLFATVNQSTPNGFPIGRHVVFMTDGVMNVKPDRYNVYGINDLGARLGPTSSSETELEARQSQRFQLMCDAAKAKNMTVWVVQFGVSTVTTNMRDCATSPDHAAAASNNAALKAAFSDIAKTIGGLRLSQ